MMGQWALYNEGWLLSTKVNRAPWDAFGPANPDPLNNQTLELYNLNNDFSQTTDLATQNPGKLKEMKAAFIAEANKYQVFPLDASVAARIVAPRPNITAGRTEFVYTHPMVGLPQGDSPLLLNTSYSVSADIEVPAGGAEGMLLTSGGRFGGYGFYLKNSKPVWVWNMVDLERLKWEGTEALAPGKHKVVFDFVYDGKGAGTLAFNDFSGVGRPGTGTLKVDGKAVATKTMAKTLPMILQWDESFDVGSDTLTGVNDADYQPPFRFTGNLDKLTIKLDRPKLSPEEIRSLEAAMRTKAASE
jgi:arylsulfatase